MEQAWLSVSRDGQLHCGGLLDSFTHPPFVVGSGRHFRGLLLDLPACPQGPPPTAHQVATRHQPPNGLQLWPGHHHLCLRLMLHWPLDHQLAAHHWPTDCWAPYLRTWHLYPCPQRGFLWHPSPWLPACPSLFTPQHVAYHPEHHLAEWTFCLRDR
jgi:hypothetical protein